MTDDPRDDPTEMAPGDEAPESSESTGAGPCPRCAGSGSVDGETCPDCGGTGQVVEGVGGG